MIRPAIGYPRDIVIRPAIGYPRDIVIRPAIGYPRDIVIRRPRKRKINNVLLKTISLNCITTISDYSEVTGRAYEHKMQNNLLVLKLSPCSKCKLFLFG